MIYSLKKIFLGLVALFAVLPVLGQNPTVNAHAPLIVPVGEVFKIEFRSDTKPNEFIPPAITEFDIIAGPTPSTGTNVVIINGNVQSTSSFTYTYILTSAKTGKFTIPSAGFVIGGKTHYTKQLVVEVAQESAPGTSQQTKQTSGAANKIAADDIILRTNVSQTTVFKGQPIRVVIKLYSRVKLSGFSSQKLPSFNGFWTQNVTAVDYPPQHETLNGKIYGVNILNEYLAYPQQSGKLSIEQTELTVIVPITSPTKPRSLIDDFFGGAANIEEVSRKLSSPPAIVTVKELPTNAPLSFNGAVGAFTMDVVTPQGSIAANSAATYSIKISGTGNLPLIQAPKIELPSSFEQYTPKTTESLAPGTEGIRGFRQFDYPFITRAEGQYKIEPFEFTYFDPTQARYVTLKSNSATVNVTPDALGTSRSSGVIVGGVSKEDVNILNEDIRFIKIGRSGLAQIGSMFMGTLPYYICILLLVIIFLCLLFYLRKRIKDRHNTIAIKGRRANKVALQRLNAAGGFMKDNNRRQFYQEMLQAFWGYLSDKLNIPVANLTKDNVRDELTKRGVSADQIEKFIGVISDCELAQYSPDQAGHMQEVYNNAVSSISKLEAIIKKSV